MFDQTNPNQPAGPEPEDMLSSVESAPKGQSALAAGMLKPVAAPPAPPPTPSSTPVRPAEEIEVRPPLFSKRNLLIAGGAVLLIIVAVAIFLVIRGAGSGAPVAAPPTPAPTVEVTPAPEPPSLVIPEAPLLPLVPEAPITPPDSDGDGLSDAEEALLGTNSLEADTDRDGLNDREEARVWQTNPLNPDSDGDGFSDGQEVQNGYNPNGPGKLLGPPPVSQ